MTTEASLLEAQIPVVMPSAMYKHHHAGPVNIDTINTTAIMMKFNIGRQPVIP